MCRDASLRVVRGLGGSGSGRCIPGEGGGSLELEAFAAVMGAGSGAGGSGSSGCGASSTMTIFFFLGALSGAPLGRPRFLGSGSAGVSGILSFVAGVLSDVAGILSVVAGIVSFVSGVVSIVSAILLLLNIFLVDCQLKTNIGNKCEKIVVPVSQLEGQGLRGLGGDVEPYIPGGTIAHHTSKWLRDNCRH